MWGHLKLFHPVEYENLRKGGVSNNSEYSMCTTKGDIETEEETIKNEIQSNSGYRKGKNYEMDIPPTRTTCEDGESYPKTKCRQYKYTNRVDSRRY